MKLRVYGLVKDNKTGKAITDAVIKIYLNQEELQKGKSAKNGFYELIVETDDSRIENGQQLRLTFEKEGYQTQEHHVLATEGAFNLDVALKMVASPSHFKWMPVIVAGIALLVILIGGAIAWWIISSPNPPEIINFSIDTNSIMTGKSAMLSWETSDAVNVSISPDIGNVEASGTKTVSPHQTTAYTLIAKNEKGKAIEKTVQVRVSIPPPPKIVFFEASQPTIKKGEQAALRWETSNTVNVSISPDIGNVEASGTKTVSPHQTTAYTLIAKNEEEKTVEKTVQVRVSIPPPPQIAFFEAGQPIIKKGKHTALKWETSNTVNVSISPDIGNVEASGTRTVSPLQTTTYILIAKDEEGKTVEKTVQVRVTIPPPPKIVFFEASQPSIKKGKHTALKWETSNAVNVLILPDVGSVKASGTKTVSPAQTTTYILIAKNEEGKTVEKTVQVSVTIPPPPKIVFFEASQPIIKKGRQSALRWRTSNAVNVFILPDVGSVGASGTKTVNPPQTTTYTLIAKNEEGKAVEGKAQIRVVPFKDEYYKISAKHSGKCLDVKAGSKADGANIQQYRCHGGNNQVFRIQLIGNSYYKISAKNSGKCLDVKGGSRADGTNIQQYSCHGADNQLFRIESVGNRYYKISAKNSGKCLDVKGKDRADGANIQQYRCHGGDNQLFRIVSE